jgi:hypothetical protein
MCFGIVGCGVLPHPARLDSLTSAGTSLLDFKRGVPVAQPHGGRESRKRKHHSDYTALQTSWRPQQVSSPTSRQPRPRLRPRQGDQVRASATDTLASANDTRPKIMFFFFSNLLSVLRNCRVRGCPTRRGWTTCPALARPSCIIRGACPLHDLKEV